MGILDELRAVAGKLLNRRVQKKPSNAYAVEVRYGAAGITPAVSKIGSPVKNEGSQRTDEYVFYPDGREKIGRILSKLSKFALVSAVDESLKTVAGGSKITKEGLKDKSPSHPSTRVEKQDVTAVMEEMQAKMEKLQDDMNNTKQQNVVSTKCISGLDSFEFSDDPIKSSTPSKSNRKKMMALELGVHKIRVNSIAPGIFKSELTESLIQQKWFHGVISRTAPLRTIGTTDPALTSLVRYLIHASSEYVSGNVFIVDSGATLIGVPIFSSL